MGLSNFDGEKEEGEGGGGHTKGGLGLVVPPLIFTSYVFPPKREKEVEGDTHGVASIGGEFFWVGAEIRDFSFHFDDKTGEKKGGRWIDLPPVPPLFLLFYFFLWSTWKSSQLDTVVFLRRGIPKLLFLSREGFFLLECVSA